MKQLLDLNDITLIPKKLSNIDSRSECDTKYLSDNNYRQNSYPIFAAPMASVVNQFNYKDFLLNNINPVIPRTVDLQTRIDLCGNIFAAFSLKEAYDIITDDIKINHSSFKICIDIANGHMSELLNTIHSLKIKYGSSIEIMSGNIANPDTYFEYARAGCDYVRCSIGTGQACFIGNTNIKMNNKIYKKICDINIGDLVYTKNGIKPVTNIFKKYVDKTLIINNEIECTDNHEFFVINKIDLDKVNEENYKNFAYFIKAKELNKNKHLLIKIE